jgi:hypothetical protein
MPYAANTELLYGVHSPGGYEIPLARIWNFMLGVSRNDPDAIIIDAKDLLATRDRRMDMLSTKYYAVYNGEPSYRAFQAQTDRFRYVYQYGDTSLFENLKAMSPAFLVPSGGIRVIKEAARQIELIRSPDFDPERTVILSAPVPLAPSDKPVGRLSWISKGNSTFHLKIDDAQDSVLVVSQTYYPGWKAFVDGKATPVFPADYALTGIAIGPGSHDVVFSFSPRSFKIGLGISVLSSVIMVALLWRPGIRLARS